MAGDIDARLTSLAADLFREAVRVYDRDDLERWLGGSNPVLAAVQVGTMTGGFPAISGAFPAISSARPEAEVTLKKVFGLGNQVAAVRLPREAELALQARSAPLMSRLETLARWLGPNGRLVTKDDELQDADAVEAARLLGVRAEYVSYLWEYALTAGWFGLYDEPDSGRTWAVHGESARRWADGDDSGALHVWSAVFAAVLATTLDVAASWDREFSRKLHFQGQGAAAAVLLFLARRTGMSVADVRELIRDGAVGAATWSRARRAWDTWVRKHGDPARLLLNELAALDAVTVPDGDTGRVELMPLALWALREQFRRDGVKVPLLPWNVRQMTAADLVAMADGVSEAQFDAESAIWVADRRPEQASRDLLAFAAFSGPQPRLAAVELTRGIGVGAYKAWRDAMQRPELRGYARIALSVMADELPESTMPLVLDPNPDDLTWVATDLLALACGEDDPDPKRIAEQFREAVPRGEESWIFDLMSRSSHPDVVEVLTVLGRHHPERRVARDARRAAHRAAHNRTGPRADLERIPARTAGR
jgi:hypothetical protein